MGDVLRPDLCVVGAGPGGFTAAATAALSGAPVVLIANERLDGPWRSAGSAAAAALSAAGAHVRAVRDTTFLGIGAGKGRINQPRVHAHVQRVVASVAAEESPYRLAALGVQVINDEPRFIDPRSLVVGGVTIAARRFLIATGSEPVIPDIPGLADIEVLTDDTILDTIHNPERLVIIGAGRTGMTLAQAQRRLGAEVVLIDRGPALRREDPEIAAFAVAGLKREGVVIYEHTTIRRVTAAGDVVRIEIEAGENAPKTIEASHVCVAVGRKPILDGLDLAAGGITANETGIVTARGSKTSNRRVYALGTSAGRDADSHFAAHLAKDEARRIVRRVLLSARAPQPAAIPRLTMTDPEIATVGLSEAEARARMRKIRILRASFTQNERAAANRVAAGEIKAVVSRGGRILGCAIAGPSAGDLILPWALAIDQGLTIGQLSRLEMPSSVYSAASLEAAFSFFAAETPSRWRQGVAGILRLFG
jgi:pyruvate/2-oxoglutarate dehydrogenase complex dihydrolipoamide dehydrogenase (E3) component